MPEKKYRIAYLSADDPKDVHVWSGTHYSIYNALLKHLGEVEILGPYSNPAINLALKFKKAHYKLLVGKRYNAYHSKLLSKTYARFFGRKLKGKGFDFIIAVSASGELAYLKTNIPVVFVSDALFSGSFNYYKTLSNLSKASIKEGFLIEKRALERSRFFYFPSEWVRANAIKDFDIKAEDTAVGPFGANLTGIPSKEKVFAYKEKKDNSFINLLFVGVNWKNKGGEVAYECLKELLLMGYKAKLTIVGCEVPEKFKHPDLITIPFIHKNTEEGRKQFEQVYLNADFLILPTRFEAYGIIFCEASAYGVVNLSTNTGGISTPVREGVNGFLLKPGSSGKDYAEKVISIYKDKTLFNSLQQSARKRYEEVLNWDAWAINLRKLLLEKKIIKS